MTEVFPCRPACVGVHGRRPASWPGHAAPRDGEYWIERPDCSRPRRGRSLLGRASIEPDEPLSWHPALRVGTQAVVSSAPFRWLVATSLGGAAVSTAVSHAPAFMTTAAGPAAGQTIAYFPKPGMRACGTARLAGRWHQGGRIAAEKSGCRHIRDINPRNNLCGGKLAGPPASRSPPSGTPACGHSGT